MSKLDTKAKATIPVDSKDTTIKVVTDATSEVTEENKTTEVISDTPSVQAPRAIKREEVTKVASDELGEKRDPKLDDINRRSYETTRREIEVEFKDKGVDYILNLDAKSMDSQRKSEVDAAIKHFWGKEGATNLEQAKKIINETIESQSKPQFKVDDNNIDEIIDRKVEEKLREKESKADRSKREAEEDTKLQEFLDKNEFLKPENDPEDKNWKKFDETFTKFNKLGDEFSFEEKLDMALSKSFGDDLNSLPSKNIGNVPILSMGTRPKAEKSLKDNPYLNFLPKDSIKNLEAAGKL